MRHKGEKRTEPTQYGGPNLSEVVRQTEDLFPGSPVGIEVETDPEEPEFPFVVFNVQSPETVKQIVAKHAAWHEKISQLRPRSTASLRLSVSSQ